MDALDFKEMPVEDRDRNQLMALVTSIKLKGKKGQAKGKSPRKCYECDGEGHIARARN